MRLAYEVAEQLFARLRGKMLGEVTGLSGTIPEIAITSGGRARALELLAQSQYSGAAPISLESYLAQVRRQSARGVAVRPADIQRAFSHLIFEDDILAQFGTALNSGAPVFLYGPAGVGKSAAAEAFSRVMADDEVAVPYAVVIDGQIITVYDPVVHRPIPGEAAGERDERWVRCKRPTVMVGGELTVEMLDLQFNPVNRYYDGPPQMKANNGVLVIDDFGRQRIPPESLLNRWVVPLDRRIDFLSLAGGRKFQIPFEMLVVFASNLDPATLLDPAFLRRIQTKIKLGAASDDQFSAIFRRVAAERGMGVDESVLADLIVTIRETLHEDLRACYPRDLVNQVSWAARYQGVQPRLDRASLRRALKTYFVAPA
jgi:predicted ATPase with chaperone activity